MHSQGRRRDDRRATDSTACCNRLEQSNVARDVRRENPGLGNHGNPRVVGGKRISTQRRSSLGSGGDTAMSDLEFQRELSPDQLREALSLLDCAAGVKPQNSQVGDLSPAEGDPGADEPCATMA